MVTDNIEVITIHERRYASEDQPLDSNSPTSSSAPKVTLKTSSSTTKEANPEDVDSGSCKESRNGWMEDTSSRKTEWQPRLAFPSIPSPRTPESVTKHSSTHLDKDRRGASPATTWPQRSPIDPGTNHEHDVSVLLAQSFDTLSESGNYSGSVHRETFGDNNHYSSSSDRLRNNQNGLRDGPPRIVDLSLRNSGPESFIGDISPIKLDESRRASSNDYQPRQRYNLAWQNQRRPHTPIRPYPVFESPYKSLQSNGHGHSEYKEFETFPSNPFYVLRSLHQAFSSCSYLLPCLRDRNMCRINLSRYANIQRHHEKTTIPDEVDIKIAVRRVEAAIYALGGYMKPKETGPHEATSIFRMRGHRKTQSEKIYESCFSDRYVVNANSISWEVEEHPPVNPRERQDLEPTRRDRCTKLNSKNGRASPSSIEEPSFGTVLRKPISGDSPSSTASLIPSDSQQKMKYRCKLCGQLKQNHDCPYRQSLQRCIAVMVYPVVNAYTASEPGVLTKDLTEMNNFVSYEFEDFNHIEGKWQRSIPMPHVTPEVKTRHLHSPESSLSTHSPSPHRNYSSKEYFNPFSRGTYYGTGESSLRKRSHVDMSERSDEDPIQMARKPLLATLTLRPEHYRAVTPSSQDDDSGQGSKYQYPSVPLSFNERKRLSETLFFFSKQVLNLTVDIAASLRIAREKEEWDMAVAQLLTQIIVGLHCVKDDHRLDGLKRYLLEMGISC